MATKTLKKKSTKKHLKKVAPQKGFWQRKDLLYPIFAVLALCFLVYIPSLQNDFVNWDDGDFIYNNESIRALSFENIKIFFTTNVLGAYAPLVFLSYAVEYQLFELNPFYYHLDNLLLHLGCIFLVYRIGLMLKLNMVGAVILAVLFGIHPMKVESVAWVTERKDVLFGIFFLGAIFYYLKNRMSEKVQAKYTALTILFFVLALFSKIQAVAFPLALLAIDYYLKRPINFKLITEKIPYFGLSLAFGLLGVFVLSSEGVIEAKLFSFGERLFLGGFSFIVYLVKFIFPYEMVTLVPYPNVLEWHHYAVPFLSLPIFYAVWVAHQKGKTAIVFGFLFFFFNIVFMLQILGAGQGFQADRYTYLAYMGLCFILAYYAQMGLGNRGSNLYTKIALGSYLLMFCSMTWQQNKVWKNGETLWTHVLQYYSNASTPWSNLGQYYRDQGQTQLALTNYSKAIEMKPNDAGALNSRGKLHFDNGNAQLAITDYNSAINAKADMAESFINRGAAYGSLQQMDQAIADVTEGLRLEPTSQNGYLNRSVLYNMLGQYAKAIEDHTSYLALNPIKSEMWYERAIAKRRLGQDAESIPDFNQAIQLEQRDIFYLERAKTFNALGNPTQAIQDAQQAQALGSKEAVGLLQQLQ